MLISTPCWMIVVTLVSQGTFQDTSKEHTESRTALSAFSSLSTRSFSATSSGNERDSQAESLVLDTSEVGPEATVGVCISIGRPIWSRTDRIVKMLVVIQAEAAIVRTARA